MEQLKKTILEETQLGREQSENLIDLLIDIGCNPDELQEVYDSRGIEGLNEYAITYRYKIAELRKSKKL